MSNEPVAMETVAPMAPVTYQRNVRNDLESSIPKPWYALAYPALKLDPPLMARAMVAPDVDHPDGTPQHNARGMTVLQQHVAFFDQDNSGVVYPWETYKGLRKIGFGILFSVIGGLGFNLFFSYPTLPNYLPSLLLPVYIANIHKGKHPSDSATYDTEGRYMPVNFENMFSKYGKTEHDKLSLKELWDMTEGNRVALDLIGCFEQVYMLPGHFEEFNNQYDFKLQGRSRKILNKLEWGAVYIIAKDEDGYLSKESMRGLFDGSLFENLAKKNARKDKKS